MEDEKRMIFEELMGDKETEESMSFLLQLARDQKPSFLVYVRILRDIFEHKQEQGNSATELYVDRKYAYMKRELERLQTERDNSALHPLDEKLDKILGAIDKKRVKTPTALGQEGEDWVLEGLNEAFPAIPGWNAFKTEAYHSGDIVLQADNLTIMFEVKNYAKASPVKKPGQSAPQIDKFFSDAVNQASGYRYTEVYRLKLRTVQCRVQAISSRPNKGTMVACP